jgi:LSD1 subclass zinc finger protein
MSAIECHSCSKPLDLQPGAKIMRSDECPHCYANIHCCKMCDFYDITAYNECRETNADRILEKDKANFCDYFILSGTNNSGGNSKDDLLNAANSLFKD